MKTPSPHTIIAKRYQYENISDGGIELADSAESLMFEAVVSEEGTVPVGTVFTSRPSPEVVVLVIRGKEYFSIPCDHVTAIIEPSDLEVSSIVIPDGLTIQ